MCDPETRKNCATLKESLMDIDSNFDDDYKSINSLNSKKKKKEPEIKPKKKVSFDCAEENLSIEETFDYDHNDENMSDEGSFDDVEDENISDEETLDEECGDENISDEEHFGNNRKAKFDYDHEEDFDYGTEEISSHEDYSASEIDEGLSDNNFNTNTKIKNVKEDIYGRMRKSDGTVIVSNLINIKIFFFNFSLSLYINNRKNHQFTFLHI